METALDTALAGVAWALAGVLVVFSLAGLYVAYWYGRAVKAMGAGVEEKVDTLWKDQEQTEEVLFDQDWVLFGSDEEGGQKGLVQKVTELEQYHKDIQDENRLLSEQLHEATNPHTDCEKCNGDPNLCFPSQCPTTQGGGLKSAKMDSAPFYPSQCPREHEHADVEERPDQGTTPIKFYADTAITASAYKVPETITITPANVAMVGTAPCAPFDWTTISKLGATIEVKTAPIPGYIQKEITKNLDREEK